MSTKIEEKEFETATFEEMVEAVEKYVKNYEKNLYRALKNNNLVK